MDAVPRTPVPVNEPVRQYQPGSHERTVLAAAVDFSFCAVAGEILALSLYFRSKRYTWHGKHCCA